jgi:hypothetical protein
MILVEWVEWASNTGRFGNLRYSVMCFWEMPPAGVTP